MKSSESVLGAYGLKSRIWPFERSRVRRKSKISGQLGQGYLPKKNKMCVCVGGGGV